MDSCVRAACANVQAPQLALPILTYPRLGQQECRCHTLANFGEPK